MKTITDCSFLFQSHPGHSQDVGGEKQPLQGSYTAAQMETQKFHSSSSKNLVCPCYALIPFQKVLV